MKTKKYSITHIYEQPEPPEGQEAETPHIVVLKNEHGYTLTYIVESTLLSDLNINDIVSFENETPHLGTNQATNISSQKELYLGMFDENLSEDEVKSRHLPSFPI